MKTKCSIIHQGHIFMICCKELLWLFQWHHYCVRNPSTKQLQSMQLRSTIRLQFCLLWTILFLPALLGRCYAQVDCEERPSYINCVSEFESNDEWLMCGDSDSKVIFKHNTYTCILYIHTHAHIIHIYIVHTLYIHMYIKKRGKFNWTFGITCMCSHSEFV